MARQVNLPLCRNSFTQESTWERPWHFDMNELDDVDDLLGGSGIERLVNFQILSYRLIVVRSSDDGCFAVMTSNTC
jgi:hypothetical protein